MQRDRGATSAARRQGERHAAKEVFPLPLSLPAGTWANGAVLILM